MSVIERGHLPGVPVSAHRNVPVADLHRFLIAPERTTTELDTAWEVLLERARRDADWQLVALGVAAPRLAQIAARTAGRVYVAVREEIAAAVLGGFAEALLTVTPESGRGLIAHQLLRRAQAAGQKVVDQRKAACKRQPTEAEREEHLPEPGTVGRGASHPDLALARLVARGVITAQEADLIGRHRIEGVTLRRLGAERGWYPMQATRALRAAEHKVARALGYAQPGTARRATVHTAEA
ncbi:hypothetical protein KDL01_37920 [Actinospica durhamensis]|uniref:Uncharacterized protein n=1 Tax=Actinospica durhamensis TaxID=1508375 RepID=A0A941EY00_9ACTN|nr:hypothetical protein [Actinospica durhamensis]MBR7839106.1 hypothetical protein [Actinospica durhamensis]